MKILVLIYLSVTLLILSFEFLHDVYPQIMKFTIIIIHQLKILHIKFSEGIIKLESM